MPLNVGHYWPNNTTLSLIIFQYSKTLLWEQNQVPDTVTLNFSVPFLYLCGHGSSVSIVTDYGLGGPGIESRWEARFSAPVQTGPGAHTASCTMSSQSFPGVKSGRDVTLTPHPLLVPWSWKSRATPLLPIWAVRPVQSLSTCTRVTFTFTFFLTYASHDTFYSLFFIRIWRR